VFDESSVFEHMFAMPAGDDKTVDGASDERPLKLDGISEVDFRALMHYLLPLYVLLCNHRPTVALSTDAMNVCSPGRPEMTEQTWTSILRLSTLWNFARSREDAIRAIRTLALPPASRARLARDFNVPGWQIPALRELAIQTSPLTMRDVEVLGVETVLRLAGLREQFGAVATAAVMERRKAELDMCHVHSAHLAELRSAHDLEVSALKMEAEDAERHADSAAKRASTSYMIPIPSGSPSARSTPYSRPTAHKQSKEKSSAKFSKLTADFNSANVAKQGALRKELNETSVLTDAMIRVMFDLGHDA
jgi:hypothetical protein